MLLRRHQQGLMPGSLRQQPLYLKSKHRLWGQPLLQKKQRKRRPPELGFPILRLPKQRSMQQKMRKRRPPMRRLPRSVVGPTAPAEKAEKAASTGVRVSDTKVAETEIDAAKNAEAKTSDAAIAETRAEPALTFGQTEPERSPRRLAVPAILIGIVVIAAFAGGVWWKLKMSEVGSSMVHSEAPVKPVTATPRSEERR